MTNGYLPAEDGAHHPNVILFYTWGSHNALELRDPLGRPLFPELTYQYMIERSRLVGGWRYMREYANDLLDPAPATDHSALPPV